MDTQRREWDELNESQRNCLMWPDLLVWDQPTDDVEIHRTDPDASLGLVSVAVQDQETKEWYNITKRIKENCPAHTYVEPYKWIVKVDGTATTNFPRDKFSSLIKNGKNVVCLSLKKAVDSLTKFGKKWGAEKIVTLNLKEGNNFIEGCRLVHFYCKGKNDNIKDRILVWEIKPDVETSETLHRGDELLEVNGQLIEGKKLAEIYKLILCKVPEEVKLKMKEIQHNMCNGEEMATNSIAVDCVDEIPKKSTDASVLQENASPECDEPPQCIVVEKEMDMNAGRKESEIYENDVFEDDDEGQSTVSETTVKPEEDSAGSKKPVQEGKKPRRLSFTNLRRLSSKGSGPGGNKVSSEVPTIENEGYNETPPPVRKFSTTSDKMCGTCVSKSETQLPDDRNKWPIDKIELSFHQSICKLLDLDDRSNEPLLSALGCFTSDMAESIKQQFKATGGSGIANKALGMWGTSHRENNVGALKEILRNTMKRVDVLGEIEKWEKKFVCHGCGIKGNNSNVETLA